MIDRRAFVVLAVAAMASCAQPAAVNDSAQPQRTSLPAKPRPGQARLLHIPSGPDAPPGHFQPKVGQFDKIDRIALGAPEGVGRSTEALASFVGTYAKSDLEKTRLLFRWITANIAYDYQSFLSGNVRAFDVQPEHVLAARKGVCDGYAGLFLDVGHRVGLTVVKLTGYAKAYGYVSGERPQSNHAWNAVRLDGQWYLLDATWAAGYLNDQRTFTRRFSEHYFLTAPEQMINRHLPDDPRWQLLSPAVPVDKFVTSNWYSSEFYQLGLGYQDFRVKQNHVDAPGEFATSIQAPSGALLGAMVTSNRPMPPGNWAMVQRVQDRYDIRTRFPAAGDYVIHVFGKAASDPGNSFSGVLEIYVAAKGGANTPFPQVFMGAAEQQIELHAPLDGTLKAGRSYEFELKAPGVKSVVISNGGKMTPMQRQDNRFTLSLAPSEGDLDILLAQTSSSYTGLAKYTVKR